MIINTKNLFLYKIKDMDIKELNLWKSIKIVIIYEYLLMFAIGPLICIIIDNLFIGKVGDIKISEALNYLILSITYYFSLRLMLKKYIAPSKILKKKKLSIKYYYIVILSVLGLYLILSSTLIRITIHIPDYTDYVTARNITIIKDLPLSDQVIMIIYSCLVLPIVEEFIHRRVILGGLVKRYTVLKALIISSCIFAISHGSTQQIINVLPFGFVLGVIYLRTYSIKLSIVAHCFYNLLATTFEEYKVFQPNETTYIILLVIGISISYFYLKSFIIATKTAEGSSN